MPRKSQFPSLADDNSAPGGAAAVDRALTLLAAFTYRDTALTLGELSARTKLHKSTALRLLASLDHAKLIQKLEDGRYGLGSEIARLSSVYAASFSLDKVVMPVLRELVATTGESAAYHVRQGETRLCLYRVDSPHPIRDHIRAGDLLPLGRGTGGRVLVAFDPTLDSSYGKSDRKLYASIRAAGFYTSVGDRLSEVAGISAPVFRSDGSLVAALTLTMPAHRYDERLAINVLTSARTLTCLMP